MHTLLVLIALAVALAAPASASAIGVPAADPSSLELRTHDAGSTVHLGGGRSTMSGWLVGVTAAAIIVGTFALALWTESQRADDSGLDGGDDSGGGDPELPQPPAGSGGEDLQWSMFETEFWDYVRSRERRRERAGRR